MYKHFFSDFVSRKHEVLLTSLNKASHQQTESYRWPYRVTGWTTWRKSMTSHQKRLLCWHFDRRKNFMLAMGCLLGNATEPKKAPSPVLSWIFFFFICVSNNAYLNIGITDHESVFLRFMQKFGLMYHLGSSDELQRPCYKVKDFSKYSHINNTLFKEFNFQSD